MIFWLQKGTGHVQRIVNGVRLPSQLLDLNVTRDGLLGIAINKPFTANNSHGINNPTYVFLYLVLIERITLPIP